MPITIKVLPFASEGSARVPKFVFNLIIVTEATFHEGALSTLARFAG
jgi:hypothetical protein